MTPEHLRTLLRTTVTRYARTIADGSMPSGLVEELAGIADQHAIDENLAAVNRALAARTADATAKTPARRAERVAPPISRPIA